MTQRQGQGERNMLREHAGTELLLFINTQSLNATQIVRPVRGESGKGAELQMPSQSQLETSAHAERHYAVTEIAELWNLSADKVRIDGHYFISPIGEVPRRDRTSGAPFSY